MNSEAPSRNQLDLALERTAIAYDRTLLAWIRTAMAFITFGFTAATVLRSLLDKGYLVGVRPHAPRNFGLTLVLLGLVGLAGGLWEHARGMKAIRAAGAPRRMSATRTIAYLLEVVGVLLVAKMLLELGPY